MSRHQAREQALQVLFAIDLGRSTPEEALAQTAAEAGVTPEWEYARWLVLGAWAERAASDAEIARLAREWRLERMPGVDRNILRLAIYELTHGVDVPASVVADEAVRLAHDFSTADSGRFVNGILGTLIRERAASGPAREVAPNAPGDVPGD